MEINHEKHYLGSICKRKHEYKNTGCSFRYKNSGQCIECVSITSKIYHKNNPDVERKSKIKYKKNNKEKISVSGKKYYLANKDKKRIIQIRCRKKGIKNLSNWYIRGTIHNELNIDYVKITPIMVIIKRDIIKLKRLKKELCHEFIAKGNKRNPRFDR